jgi:ketosteroid isomerase-like protein
MTTTNIASTHAATVAAIYEAFGRGDVDAILERLAEDIVWDADWTNNYAQRGGLFLMTPRRGRAAVAEFFAALATVQIHDFQVLDLMASERQVTAQIGIELSHANGGRVRDDELHLWTFDIAGEVTAFRHYVDTAKHLAAATGEDTTNPA